MKAIVPEIIDMEERKLIGLSVRTSIRDNTANRTVARLWETVSQRLRDIPESISSRRVGALTFPSIFHPETSEFVYFAGYEARESEEAPAGMETQIVPSGRYVAFANDGLLSEIDFIYAYYNNVWLPQSGYEGTGGIEVELYEEAFAGVDRGKNEPIVCFPIRQAERGGE
nr:GyrI-like domain-containing protein [Paenibacillus flagellatus]